MLLFDEPTSALDPEMVGEVLDVIQGLALHRRHYGGGDPAEMGFARRVADRILFMCEGRIVEQGPPGKLFDTPEDPRLRGFLQAVLSH